MRKKKIYNEDLVSVIIPTYSRYKLNTINSIKNKSIKM